jgi:hypothetical protein
VAPRVRWINLRSAIAGAACALAVSSLPGCENRCDAEDITTRYGFEAGFERPITVTDNKLLEIKVYWTPLGSTGFHEPIAHCISDQARNVHCTDDEQVIMDGGQVTGILFKSDSLKPDRIRVVIEARPTVSSGPVELVAEGETALVYRASTHEILCSDGKTEQIERATTTFALRP